MKRIGWLISKYTIQSVLPYFFFSWLLLSVILFVQQASRYADIFFSLSIPKNLVWQLTLALVPNVIAFTCPMAVLVGVIIGLSRMQGDSELIAVRSIGVGNFQLVIPMAMFGIALSAFTFLINLYGVPFAAQIVRKVALQTALYKLESPIEPGSFNTEVNGYTIYVKEGDFKNGTWKNIFIFNEDKSNETARLITSKSGRVDSDQDSSELVLENAVVSTFSTSASARSKPEKFASENVGQIRFAIKTRRGEIVEKLSKTEETPEELGLSELARYSRTKEGKEKIDALIIWQRRVLLSITPLIFALLGTALILRFNRGGRGFGIFLALVSLIIYYLLALFGEQLARTNKISVAAAGIIPVLISSAVICWFFLANRFPLKKTFDKFGKSLRINFPSFAGKKIGGNLYLKNRILDFDIVANLIRYFLLTFFFLTSIYMIFTAFELWKFVGEIDNGAFLLLKYLLFLIPFIYLQLAPSALMVATLATFVIKSRQNEVVTWTAAGRSVYRLLLPCFMLTILIGFINWGIQEKIAPATNKIQDELRAQIRSRNAVSSPTGKFWIASGNRIFSFEMNDQEDARWRKITNLSVFEFAADESKLQVIYQSPEAVWEKGKIKFSDSAEKRVWNDGIFGVTSFANGELDENSNPFSNFNEKPAHLSASELKDQISHSESESERKSFEVAFEKKYATLFLPFVITLFTAPFALSLSRKGRVVTVGYAIGVWLLFMGITSVFEQFGLNGYLAPSIAVWSPLFLFSIVGAFMLSKVRT